MHVEQVGTCENCRRIRLGLMGLLIVFAALAGYHWGYILERMNSGGQERGVIVLGVAFTFLALFTAVWVEVVVTRTERDAELAHSLEARKSEEASIEREHAQELDRLVDKLSEDNSDLRYRLLSSKVHEVGEQIAQDLKGSPSALQ